MRRLLILLTLLLSACNMPAGNAAREAQGLQAYRLLRDAQDDRLRAMATPATGQMMTEPVLIQMHGYTRPGEPRAVKTLSWSATTVAGGRRTYVQVQQFDYFDRVVIFRTGYVKSPEGRWLLDLMRIDSVSPAEIGEAQFKLIGKSPLHYIVLLLTGLMPLFCLASAGVAGWRRRWGWMVLSLFSVGLFTLNWSTGAVGVQTFQFAILGSTAFKGAGPVDPWMLSFGIPVPAILFWALKRYRPKPPKAKKANAMEAPPAPPPDAPEL
ncbi:MAG: hypothetical protein EON87_10780 [Brevundimonas sp.]|nr:MAG: hypothetical protein EON87_10780 [Brevundimonas sp.]